MASARACQRRLASAGFALFVGGVEKGGGQGAVRRTALPPFVAISRQRARFPTGFGWVCAVPILDGVPGWIGVCGIGVPLMAPVFELFL